MTQAYNLLSPSGKHHRVYADSIYHAIQLVIIIDNGDYPVQDYFRLNKIK